MKTTLSVAIVCGALFGALTLASAATIYTENWGSPNAAVTGDGNINTVGWTGVAVSQNASPYMGIYQAGGANDPTLGLGLPVNTVYFTILLPNQTNAGMFYTTTESGSGSGGNVAFTSIDPTLYTNMTFNIEIRGADTDTNYFAVRVGGSWYVATSYKMPGSGTLGYPSFTNAALVYTNAANVWRNLTINATDVTIGSVASPSLTSPITGIGIVELPTAGGFNYNQLVINQGPADFPSSPPASTAAAITPQTVYAGGGASFLASFSGTPNLVFRWKTNGVIVPNGGRVTGAQTTMLTVTNINANDAIPTYSVVVTNFFGAATNDGMMLVVNPVPSDILYAETFPYVGPNGNLPITGVGWQAAFQGVTGIYQSGPGIGNVFSYSGVATTNIYYATTNDNGSSGLPFAPINPDSYTNVTFQANFTPGNGAGQNPTNVIAYWAVQMADGNWYSTSNRIPVQILVQNNYQPYQFAFKRAATNWNTLTIGANTATIGGPAAGPLNGNIIGVGVVIAHLGLNGGGDFNFNTFVITTNAVTISAPVIDITGAPKSQTVATSGGASFGVATSGGAQPFTYGWSLNGVRLVDGARVFGATTPTVTIANLTPADSGTVVAYVTNFVGTTDTAGITTTTLTVTDPPVGLLYSETFPFVGPVAANYPISGVGWAEGVPGTPNVIYQNIGSDGSAFAYLGIPGTTVYYTAGSSDTNQAGLRFPNIKLGSYSDLTLSADIEPGFQAENVTAYFAVQINGGPWYVAASALPVPTTGGFATYTSLFDPTAANWKNLTITGSGGLVGSTPASNLSGMMTGAGLVFVTIGSGGDFNFDNLVVTGTGLGGINIGAAAGGNLPLSWVGNPVVNLQSSTNLNSAVNWIDVPSTLGLYSTSVPMTGPQKFYRLVQHP